MNIGIPEITWLKKECNIEQCLSRLTPEESKKKFEFDPQWTPTPEPEKIFLYFYHPKVTQDKTVVIPGLLDTSSTVYVSLLEPNNMMLKPDAQELIIIGPPYEATTWGSHIDRLTRCLLHPLSRQITFEPFTNTQYYNISFHVPDISGNSLNGFAALLLNNTLQVIQAKPKPTKGSIKEKLFNEIKDSALNTFTSLWSSDKPKSRRDILKKSPRLLIHVQGSKTKVDDDQTAVRIERTSVNDGISLQEIGFGAALGLYSTIQETIDVQQSKLNQVICGHKSEQPIKDLIMNHLQNDGDRYVNQITL